MIHQSFQPSLKHVVAVLKKYEIKNAYFFGSVLTNKFNDKSDLDILINFNPEFNDPLQQGELMCNLQFEIEDIVARKVDILQESTPRNPYFIKELQETKELIYEQ